MKMRFNAYLFFLSLLLCGCKVSDEPIGNIFKFADVESVGTEKWSSQIDNFKMVPLDTNDKSLVGSINKIGYVDDVIYILSDRNKLSAFHSDGSFICNYGKIGNGPGELESFVDFDVDGEFVYIIGYNKLALFSKDGTFKEESTLKEIPSAIKKTKNGMLFYLSTPVGENCLAYMDNDGNWKSTLPKNEVLRLNRPVTWISWSNERYFFQKGNSVETVLFQEEKQQFMDVDLTDETNAMTLAEQEEIGKEQGSDGLLDSGKTVYDGLTHSACQVIFVEANQNGMFLCLNDLEQNKNSRFSFGMEDDLTFTMGKFLQNTFRCYSNGKLLVSYLEVDLLKEVFQNRDGNENYPLVMELPDESNPVILLFSFKQ